MIDVAFYAVVGGAIAGLASGKLFGRSSWLTYAAVGALGGASGLVMYAIVRTTVDRPFHLWWQGLSWILVGVLFAVMTLAVINETRRQPK